MPTGKPQTPKITLWSADEIQELFGISDEQWKSVDLSPTHYVGNAPAWHRSLLREIARKLAEEE